MALASTTSGALRNEDEIREDIVSGRRLLGWTQWTGETEWAADGAQEEAGRPLIGGTDATGLHRHWDAPCLPMDPSNRPTAAHWHPAVQPLHQSQTPSSPGYRTVPHYYTTITSTNRDPVVC